VRHGWDHTGYRVRVSHSLLTAHCQLPPAAVNTAVSIGSTRPFTGRVHTRYIHTVNTAVYRVHDRVHGRARIMDGPCTAVYMVRTRPCTRAVKTAVYTVHGPCTAMYTVRTRPRTRPCFGTYRLRTRPCSGHGRTMCMARVRPCLLCTRPCTGHVHGPSVTRSRPCTRRVHGRVQ